MITMTRKMKMMIGGAAVAVAVAVVAVAVKGRTSGSDMAEAADEIENAEPVGRAFPSTAAMAVSSV